MAIQELSANNAFIGGSELWVVPNFGSTLWCQKIDWYLNFQLSKAINIQKKSVSEEILDIVSNEDLEEPLVFSNPKYPLMISASRNLPCRYVVQIPFENLNQWLNQISDIQKSLKETKTRIFLPKDISNESFFGEAKKIFSESLELSYIGTQLTN